MEICKALKHDMREWDAFVCKHPKSSPYHLSAWSRAVHRAYGFTSHNLIARDQGKIVGVCPLILHGLPFGKKSFVSLPYCDLGSVLAADTNVEQQILTYLLSLARDKGIKSLDLRGSLKEDALENANVEAQISTGKVRMLLGMPDSSDELWGGFKSKVRSQVRKAQKNGLKFTLSDDGVDEFYKVFCINMRDLGSPVHAKKWFVEIVQQYRGQVKIGTVTYDGKPIGSGVILRVEEKISIPWASTLRKYNKLNPNMLLYWELLKYAADTGAKEFDFGRSSPGEGTYRFKKQWGAVEHPLPWYHLSLSPAKISGRSDAGRGVFRQNAEKVWRNFPLPLANVVGSLMRKYISL